jgi:hypothetical protein
MGRAFPYLVRSIRTLTEPQFENLRKKILRCLGCAEGNFFKNFPISTLQVVPSYSSLYEYGGMLREKSLLIALERT